MSNILRIVNRLRKYGVNKRFSFLLPLASSYIWKYKKISFFSRRRGASPAATCRGGGQLQRVRDVVTSSRGFSHAEQQDEDLQLRRRQTPPLVCHGACHGRPLKQGCSLSKTSDNNHSMLGSKNRWKELKNEYKWLNTPMLCYPFTPNIAKNT
jgi:hypothetical protein